MSDFRLLVGRSWSVCTRLLCCCSNAGNKRKKRPDELEGLYGSVAVRNHGTRGWDSLRMSQRCRLDSATSSSRSQPRLGSDICVGVWSHACDCASMQARAERRKPKQAQKGKNHWCRRGKKTAPCGCGRQRGQRRVLFGPLRRVQSNIESHSLSMQPKACEALARCAQGTVGPRCPSNLGRRATIKVRRPRIELLALSMFPTLVCVYLFYFFLSFFPLSRHDGCNKGALTGNEILIWRRGRKRSTRRW